MPNALIHMKILVVQNFFANNLHLILCGDHDFVLFVCVEA